jgi:hypothetical protein
MNRLASFVVIAGLLMGCGAAAPAQHLRFADAATQGGRLDWTRPIVLEFQPGDRLPVRVAFSDQIFELTPDVPQLELVAKRHGFVRIDGHRITGSLSGEDFDASPLAPGQFRFGLALTKSGSWLELAVVTPRHAEPPEQTP